MDEMTKRQLIEKVELCKKVNQDLIRVVRIQPASRDPQKLLDPANWESRSWAGYSEGVGLGVSACWDIADLANYFSDREAHLDDCVVVEMDAYEADDKDEDAEHGAVLVWPQRIVSVTPLADTAFPLLVEHNELLNRPSDPDTSDEIDARLEQIERELVDRYGEDQVRRWLLVL